MTLAFGVGFALVLSALVGAIAWRRQRKAMGRELLQEWKQLPRERRRAVVRAVRRGEAVHDPRDAEVAADYAGYLERLQAGGRWRTRFVWFEMAYVALGLVLGIVALATGGGAGVFLRLAPLAFIVAGILLRRRLRMRAERARNENARVHGVAR